jgi:hypothetical protein
MGEKAPGFIRGISAMNHEYYRQVLEDVQNDISEVEQMVSELQGIERYVQRKMETDSDNGNSKLSYDQYQTLLDDVRGDVDGARSKIGELRGVGNFAREKLKASGADVGDLKSPKPAPAPKPAPEAPPPKNDESLTQSEKSPMAQSGKGDSMKTVEFGPDGFPMAKLS